MPILDVEIVMGPSESGKAGWAQQLADLAGEILESPAGHTWVRLRVLPSPLYAENHSEPSFEARPVFVTVLKARIPPQETLQAEAHKLSEGIARAVGRPKENVHILYLPEGVGRVAFGGRLVTS